LPLVIETVPVSLYKIYLTYFSPWICETVIVLITLMLTPAVCQISENKSHSLAQNEFVTERVVTQGSNL